MATRSVSAKLLHSIRRITSSTPRCNPSIAHQYPDSDFEEPTSDTHPLNLDDTELLFETVSTSKLIKSDLTLSMASMDRMVGMGTRVMNSKVMKNRFTRKMVLESIKHTFYHHFCGGEHLGQADITVRKLWDSGLSAMLDYGLEHASDNAACDRNLEEFVRTVRAAKASLCTSVSFVVVKITAICPPSLLKRVSDLLRWRYKDASLNLPWKHQSFPVLSNSSPFYHTLKCPEPLTQEEEQDLDLAYQRLINICVNSVDAGVPLLIDAEDTSIQPAIDYFAYSAATKYTLPNGPLIYNTVQAYLKDAKDRLVNAKTAADHMGVKVGFKLVRGAYMSSERELAASFGARSPIHDNLPETHASFNSCAAFMLQQIAKGSGSVVLATHNIESGQMAAGIALSLGIEKNNQNLQFAQLYGMADPLSFSLRNAGFKVSKYLPFGPVEQVMPYLLRRAEENTALLSNSTFDRTLMRKELLRRMQIPKPCKKLEN